MRSSMSPIAQEMMSVLEELFKNPFPVDSRRWHAHQKLLRRAAIAIMNISTHIDREIDFAKARGIVTELEKDLKRMTPHPKQVEAV
jgi:hypothetical protein